MFEKESKISFNVEMATFKYTYRAKEHYDLNKSYVNRLQSTIPDYYMNKKILENKYIDY